MTEENIVAELERLMNERIPGAKVHRGQNLRRDHRFDSLDVFDFMYSVSETFKIAIAEEELKDRKLADIGNLIDFIVEKQRQPLAAGRN